MIGVIGISHTTGTLATREAVARILSSVAAGPSVLLLTCNRAEWYFSSCAPAKTHESIVAMFPEALAGKLFVFAGQDCFYHLCRVTAGLESVFVGETEIQGQVRLAYETARSQQQLPKELHILFQKALKIGKFLRSMAPTSQNLSEQVLEKVMEHAEKTKTRSLLLIGASSINRQIASKTRESGFAVAVTNRNLDHAKAFSQLTGARVLPWELLEVVWHQYPCVVAATKSQNYLLSERAPEGAPQLLIDLGVPRNISPKLASGTTIILNIEDFAPRPSIQNAILAQKTSLEYPKILVG